MKSKFLRVQARKKRRETLECKQELEMLNGICSTISFNREELELEITKISTFLDSVADIVIKYDEKSQNIVIWHIKELVKELDNVVLIKQILKQLEEVSVDVALEFFGGIDFSCFGECLESQTGKLNRLMLVWKAQKVVKNIAYQFGRIWNSYDKKYQIAVLKGMLAMH